MPDLQHATGTPETALRTPVAPAPDPEVPAAGVPSDELVRRAAGAVGAMTATNASREMVVAAATQEQGGYQAIYTKNLKRIKERIYADLAAKWFAANEANFGYLESLGDDWGQKGVFKSTLRIVMFGD